MKKNLPVTDTEHLLNEEDMIVTLTDPKGIITFANEAFIRISGFSKEELIGTSHNLVRHPDMPEAAFKDMWDTLKSGQSWMGLVKIVAKMVIFIGSVPLCPLATTIIVWWGISQYVFGPRGRQLNVRNICTGSYVQGVNRV